MKWFKLAPVLALAVALIGCGKSEDDVSTNGNADSTMMAAQKNKNKADNNEGEYDPVGDLAREENKLFESENSKTRYAALEEASDYISLVELSSDAGGGVSLKFIKNYKGALSTIELKTPKSLTPNQEYIGSVIGEEIQNFLRQKRRREIVIVGFLPHDLISNGAAHNISPRSFLFEAHHNILNSIR